MPPKTIFTGIDVSEKPHFTVNEVAQDFFGRTPYWLRLQEHDGWIEEPRRTDAGQRYYTLLDIENIARDLLLNDRISARRYTWTVDIIDRVARLHDYPIDVYGKKSCGSCKKRMTVGQAVVYDEKARKWKHDECFEAERQRRAERAQKARLKELHARPKPKKEEPEKKAKRRSA
jgi:hypothetical protein